MTEMSKTFYRRWQLYYDPPPIPDRRHDWHFVHVDYDGPEDDRCGSGANIQDCIDQIREIEHECPRCGEPNPERLQMDGCREPDCPEQE